MIGVSVNGASRWIAIAGLQFQPSDIAKLTVILFLARQISIYRNKIKILRTFLLQLLLPLFLVCVLILPNNFSTASLVFINGVVLMFLGGVKLNYITEFFNIFFDSLFDLFY